MKKILMVVGGIVLGLVVLGIGIFAVVSMTSKKMTCKSSVGDVTIMYNDEKLTGYTAAGLTYDFDSQNEYAQQIGVEAYLDEFSDWFRENASGVCTRE